MVFTLHSRRFSFSCTDFGSIAVRVFFVFSGFIICPAVKLCRRARINGISKIALDSHIWIIRWIFGLKIYTYSFKFENKKFVAKTLGFTEFWDQDFFRIQPLPVPSLIEMFLYIQKQFLSVFHFEWRHSPDRVK